MTLPVLHAVLVVHLNVESTSVTLLLSNNHNLLTCVLHIKLILCFFVVLVGVFIIFWRDTHEYVSKGTSHSIDALFKLLFDKYLKLMNCHI